MFLKIASVTWSGLARWEKELPMLSAYVAWTVGVPISLRACLGGMSRVCAPLLRAIVTRVLGTRGVM